MSITFEKMCRTCLTSDTAMLSIFENRKPGMNTEGPSSIAGMLKSFTSVVISESDGLPKKVCLACISEINRAYSFKIKCENSETTLKQYLDQLNPVEEVEEPEENVTILEVSKMECDDEISLLEAPLSVEGKSTTHNEDDEFFESHVKEILNEENQKTMEEEHLKNFEDEGSDDEVKQIFIVDTVEGSEVVVNADDNMSSILVLACSACCQTFENRDDFNAHSNSCNPDKSKPQNGQKPERKKEPLKCPHCPIDFVHKKNLDKHVQKCHNTEFLLANSKNEKETEDLTSNLNEEYEVLRENEENPSEGDDVENDGKLNVVKPKPAELPESNFHCERCGAGFAKEKSLTYHMKLNKCTQKQFECHICKRVFISKKSLTHHMDSHEKVYECAKCSQKFSHQDKLKEHMESEHNSVVKNQCPLCSKVFTMLSTLKDHLRTHSGEKPFVCSICSKGFSQSTNLKQHLMRHTKTKPYKCSQCEYSFVSKGELNAHIRKHTGDHPFVCTTCGSGFTTSSSLVKHRRIHTGERPYACEFCPMRFTALGTLKNHRRTHTGERPFNCKHCDRAFAQKSDCVSHMRTHTGERPYICPACGLSFQQSGTMKTHYKTHMKGSTTEQVESKSEGDTEKSNTEHVENDNDQHDKVYEELKEEILQLTNDKNFYKMKF